MIEAFIVYNIQPLLTEPFNVRLVDTRRWKTRAGSVSFSLSDDSSTATLAAAANIVFLLLSGKGDGVLDDELTDGIDNGDLLTIII